MQGYRECAPPQRQSKDTTTLFLSVGLRSPRCTPRAHKSPSRLMYSAWTGVPLNLTTSTLLLSLYSHRAATVAAITPSVVRSRLPTNPTHAAPLDRIAGAGRALRTPRVCGVPSSLSFLSCFTYSVVAVAAVRPSLPSALRATKTSRGATLRRSTSGSPSPSDRPFFATLLHFAIAKKRKKKTCECPCPRLQAPFYP